MASVQLSAALPAAGQVLNFKDHNGPDHDKLYVVLSDKDKDYMLIAMTTSQQRSRQKDYGCKDSGKYFFWPSQKGWFNKDTWILLNEFRRLHKTYLTASLTNRTIEIMKGSLPSNEFNALKQCLRYSFEISPHMAALL